MIIGLAIVLIIGLTVSPVSGAAFGLAAALAALLVFGQVSLVKLTELILTCSGRGRWQFPPFLEDACDRQILRQVGTVYQFRHATLQDPPRHHACLSP